MRLIDSVSIETKGYCSTILSMAGLILLLLFLVAIAVGSASGYVMVEDPMEWDEVGDLSRVFADTGFRNLEISLEFFHDVDRNLSPVGFALSWGVLWIDLDKNSSTGGNHGAEWSSEFDIGHNGMLTLSQTGSRVMGGAAGEQIAILLPLSLLGQPEGMKVVVETYVRSPPSPEHPSGAVLGSDFANFSLDLGLNLLCEDWRALQFVSALGLGSPRDLGFSPDGTTLAVASRAKLQIWDASSGDCLHLLDLPSTCWSVAWSPDGSLLAAGMTYPFGIAIVNPQTGVVENMVGEDMPLWDEILWMDWSTNGEYLIVSSETCLAPSILRIETDEFVRHLDLPGDVYPSSVAWSPDGKMIATGWIDDYLRIWDSETADLVFEEKFVDYAHAVEWSSDGGLLAVSSLSNCVVLEAPGFQQVANLTGHSSIVFDMSFSPDGSSILTGSWDETARIWDISTQVVKHVMNLSYMDYNNAILSVDWSGGNDMVAIAANEGGTQIWDSSTGSHIRNLGSSTSDMDSVCWDPTGQFFATCGRAGRITIWDTVTGEVAREGIEERGSHIAWAPVGNQICIAGRTRITIRDIETWDLELEIEPPDSYWWLRELDWSPDGGWVAFRDHGLTLYLLNIQSASIHSVAGSVQGFGWGHTDDTLIIADRHNISVINLDGDILYNIAKKPGTDLSDFLVSRDGRFAAAVLGNRTLLVWDISTTEVTHRITLRNDPYRLAAWFIDDERIALASRNGLSVIDLARGCESFSTRYRWLTRSLCCSDKMVAVGTSSGTARIYSIPGHQGLSIYPTIAALAGLFVVTAFEEGRRHAKNKDRRSGLS